MRKKQIRANTVQEALHPATAMLFKHASGKRQPLLNNEPCSTAHRRALPTGNIDELVPDRFIGRLTVKKIECVVRLSSLPVGVQSGLPIGVQRKKAYPLCRFIWVRFGKSRLIEVAAFDGDAQKQLAGAVGNFSKGIHLVGSPRLSDVLMSSVFSPTFTVSTTYSTIRGGVMPRL